VSTKFKNPRNDKDIQTASGIAWLWFLIFGPWYFLYKGIWKHFFLSTFIGIGTLGFGLLIYVFFINEITRKSYEDSGWIEIKK
tara:strand:+ start:96 stop:344 length:249 start_codon:yes stop_codon:yes gene_type:complete